jgi:hypothetical protein
MRVGCGGLQDYTLLLAKNGDVWFCGEDTVRGLKFACVAWGELHHASLSTLHVPLAPEELRMPSLCDHWVCTLCGRAVCAVFVLLLWGLPSSGSVGAARGTVCTPP